MRVKASSDREELIQEKLRLVKLQADTKEFKLKVLRGEYVKVAEVQKAYAKLAVNVKQKFLSFPTKLAPLLEGKSVREIENILTENVYEVMNEFAEGLV